MKVVGPLLVTSLVLLTGWFALTSWFEAHRGLYKATQTSTQAAQLHLQREGDQVVGVATRYAERIASGRDPDLARDDTLLLVSPQGGLREARGAAAHLFTGPGLDAGLMDLPVDAWNFFELAEKLYFVAGAETGDGADVGRVILLRPLQHSLAGNLGVITGGGINFFRNGTPVFSPDQLEQSEASTFALSDELRERVNALRKGEVLIERDERATRSFTPLETQGQQSVVGHLMVAINNDTLLNPVRLNMGLTLAVLALLCFISLHIINRATRSIVDPVSKLALEINRMATKLSEAANPSTPPSVLPMEARQENSREMLALNDTSEALKAATKRAIAREAQLERTRHELAASKAFFDKVLRSMQDLLFVIDPEGRIVMVNAATCTAFGLPESEILRRPFASFARKQGMAGTDNDFTHDWFEVQSGRPPAHFQLLPTSESAELTVSVAVSLLRDERGGLLAYVLTAKDLTSVHAVDELNVPDDPNKGDPGGPAAA